MKIFSTSELVNCSLGGTRYEVRNTKDKVRGTKYEVRDKTRDNARESAIDNSPYFVLPIPSYLVPRISYFTSPRTSYLVLRTLILAALFLISALSATAQTITGTVKDAETREPLPFANVLVEGTTTG